MVVLGAVEAADRVWRGMMERLYPNGAWARLHADTVARLRRRQLERGSPSLDVCIAELLDEAGRPLMGDRLEELLGTLLYEGYALYPYTPGAAKNSTPTPFGIVYPPVYAARVGSAHDRLKISGIASRPGAATVEAEVRFLAPVSDAHAHSAVERRLASARCRRRARRRATSSSRSISAPCPAACGCASTPSAAGCRGSRCACTTPPSRPPHPTGGPRRCASSMLSTHPVLRLSGGRFVSPLERTARSARRRDVREREHVPRARNRRRRRAARRRHDAARPPATRAREPRRPVRRHRDRGGAVAARPRAERRRARRDHRAGPRGAGHDRARRRGHAATTCSPSTGGSCSPTQRRRSDHDDRSEQPPARGDPGRGAGRPRRCRLPARRQGAPSG